MVQVARKPSGTVRTAPVSASGEQVGFPTDYVVGGGRVTSWLESWRIAMRRWRSSRTSLQSADVDEVAREVHLRLLRYSDDALADCPQDYLFRVAASVANEWSGCASSGQEVWGEADDDEVLKLAKNALVSDQVRAAVGKLPSRQREMLLLHVNDDLSYRQVAAKLKIAPHVARRDIANAYASLRCELQDTKLDVLAN